MARAIGDTIRSNMVIYTQNYCMDRDLISHGYLDNKDYLKHQEKAVFMNFAETLYGSSNYRVEKFLNDYEYVFKYQLAVFNLPTLKQKDEVK
jgi:hypothetical protein